MQQKVILFAILNWGLGHASRSVPIIQFLQRKGYKLVICTDGHVISFLEKELQDVQFEFLPPYDIEYKYDSMALNMLIQSPKIFATYRKERKVFKKLASTYKPLFCISDNRYGCLTASCPSYFMGHQWNILASNQKIHKLASWVNQYFIRKFDGYLIPDNQSAPISGLLTKSISHPNPIWLGMLSRFNKFVNVGNQESQKLYSFLSILSGPEPARTVLENKLFSYSAKHPEKQFAFVRGTNIEITGQVPTNCLIYNIVDNNKLQKLIAETEIVIGRSGYSSVMDYLSMGFSKVLFIPTPGQTEQEFLAKELKRKGYHFIEEKDVTEINLSSVLENILEKSNVSFENINSDSLSISLDSIITKAKQQLG